MRNDYLFTLKRLLIAVLLIYAVSSCNIMAALEPEEQYEYSVSNQEGYYAIDPDTIIEGITQNKTGLFTQIFGTPEANSTEVQSVQWTQEDYLNIARTLHALVWKDDWDKWEINHLFFRMNCDDAESGPQFFHVRLYKEVRVQDTGGYRVVLHIYVDPSRNLVFWNEEIKEPLRENWSSVRLSELVISADDALQIAEENGGMQTRLANKNQCVIYVRYAWNIQPVTGITVTEGWNVDYSTKDNENDHSYLIDPLNGEITSDFSR